MFGEQAAFEKAIDENPLEAQNHLTYADWLEENGHHDEAAFRKAMGDWMRAHEWQDLPPLGTTYGYHPHRRTASVGVDNAGNGSWQIYGNYAGQSPRAAVLPWGHGGGGTLPLPDYWHNDPADEMNHGVIHDLSGTLRLPGSPPVVASQPEGRVPPHVAEWNPRNGGSMQWPSYRGMEEGLRRAFMAGRQRKQLSRTGNRVRARRLSRRR